jgi:hypothetical protein
MKKVILDESIEETLSIVQLQFDRAMRVIDYITNNVHSVCHLFGRCNCKDGIDCPECIRNYVYKNEK